VIVTTNLPFSEWTQVIPNARHSLAIAHLFLIKKKGCGSSSRASGYFCSPEGAGGISLLLCVLIVKASLART
jgi:hypothetical protein